MYIKRPKLLFTRFEPRDFQKRKNSLPASHPHWFALPCTA